MNRSTLRWAITVLTLITAAIHLFIGATSLSDPQFRVLAILLLLNAAGYVVLLLGVLGKLPFLPSPAAHYLMIAFTAVTFIAYFALNGLGSLDAIAAVDKLAEALLIVATFMHLGVARRELA